MALETSSAIADALGQRLAPRLYQQWNRQAVAAAIIPAEPWRGKNVSFAAEFSGTVDADTVAEGAEVLSGELDSDVDEDAVLSWAFYRKSFGISEHTIDAAATSDGVAPSDLVQLFDTRVDAQSARLISKINRDIYTGTGTDGTDPTIVGLFGGATDSTGTYAGINRATRTEWAGTQLANGGVSRALTLSLLYQADENMFTKSGESATHILCSPGVFRKYASLFENTRRLVTDGRGPMQYNAGAGELFFKGIPLIRDKDCPAGKLVFINTNYVRMRFLPRAGVPNDAVLQQMRNLVGTSGGPNAIPTVTAIPFRLALLGKTGDSIKATLRNTLQLVVLRAGATAQIVDIDES
jgi:hypothetical protein